MKALSANGSRLEKRFSARIRFLLEPQFEKKTGKSVDNHEFYVVY